MKKLKYSRISVDADCYSYVEDVEVCVNKISPDSIIISIKTIRGVCYAEVDQEELLSAIREEIKSFQEHTNKA